MALLRWQQNIVDEEGNVLPSAEVEIRDEVSGALVNLFEDIDGNTVKGNPLTVDSDGYGFAYMEPGRFKITATSADQSFTKSWRDVRLANDFSDLDSRINQRVIYVDSVADMVAGGFSVGAAVETLGYYSPGDGGGNQYEIVAGTTGTDDGGSFIDLGNGNQAKGLFPYGVSVNQFGAGSGAGDLADFQAAIDYTTDGEIVVIGIESGDYVDDLATVTTGTRSIVWRESGDVSYATSAPPGQRTNAAYTGDKSRPWYVGEFGYGKNVTSGTAADRPIIRVQRNANHAGGTTGGSVESSALSAYTNVGSSVENYETAMLATLDHAGGITGQNLVGFHTEGRKTGNGGAITFGANIVAKDLSGNSSSVSGGALIGLETTMSSSGPDDAETRIATDIVLKKESAAASASYHAGLRIRPSSESGREATLNNGIVLDVGTGSSTLSRGILMRGGFVNGVVEAEALGNPSLMRLGSDNASAAQSVMKIEGFGQNSVAARTTYGELEYRIQSPTDGSEQGAFSAKILSNGTEITALDLQGGSSANPVFVRVNSSLKQVTEGAVDSGGSGFRVLRVPN